MRERETPEVTPPHNAKLAHAEQGRRNIGRGPNRRQKSNQVDLSLL